MVRRFATALLALLSLGLVSACGASQTAPTQQPAAKDVPAAKESGAAPAQGAKDAPAKITLMAIPTQGAQNFEQRMKKLGELLSKESGLNVEVQVGTNYAAVVEALRFGKVDGAYLGPFTYVVANAQSGARAIITMNIKGKPYYYSYLIVPKDSPLQEIRDNQGLAALKGKKFAFGDPGSTSGSLIPRLALKNAGLDPEKDIQPNFTGGHDKTLLAVANGQAEVGAIDSAIFEHTLSKNFPNEFGKVRVIWKSQELYQYPWAVRNELPAETARKLQQAFLKITDPDVLNAFGADGFVAADDQKYDDIRAAAKAFGIDLQKYQVK